jgi:hypothetical protein
MRPPAPDESANAVGASGMPISPGVAPRASPASQFLAAPFAEALAVLPPQPASLADAGVSGGGCFARPLPVDTTCAATARRYFREAVSGLSIPGGLLDDGVTMASELAANTLHAQRELALGLARQHAAGGVPEMWVYLRGDGRRCELVCKVFDAHREWQAPIQAAGPDAAADSVSGRGLQVVEGLSAGSWGCHPTRSRLGTWKTQGKAVWFALRIPRSATPDNCGRPRNGVDWLVDELEGMLTERGLGGIVRADAEALTVLSISRHLTVWRHGSTLTWRAGSGQYQRLSLDDIIEAAEQIVCAHEESQLAEPGNGPWVPAATPALG